MIQIMNLLMERVEHLVRVGALTKQHDAFDHIAVVQR